jgi:hypothetical protein
MLVKPARLIGGMLLLVGVLAGGRAGACSLCGAMGGLATPTFRQEAALPQARLILHGTVGNARLSGADLTGGGQTDFHIKTIIRSDPAIKGKEMLVLPKYLPSNKAEPPHYLLICDVDKGRIDPYRGIRIKGQASAEYVKKALAQGKDRAKSLEFFFRYLDDPDPEVSRDAFLEFAKASDADIAAVAPKLSADKLRAWMTDAKTPPERLGVFALLLGATGKPADADYLRKLLDSKEERYRSALAGMLAGYIQARPKEGWSLTQDILADGRKPLMLRLAAVQSMRFYQGAQPKESKPHILKSMKLVLAQGDLADLAVEDLRRWQLWDLTADVLKLYGQRGYDAPLMKMAILRYALCCKSRKDAGEFVKARRAAEPDVVQQVEEGLKFESQR